MTAHRALVFLGVAMVLGVSSRGASAAGVKVGEAAPDFTLSDFNGQTRSLSEFGGKLIVLEWLNHDCPFVKKHYRSGNMQRLQRTYTDQGVVWLSINSSAPRKQGHLTPEKARRLTEEKGAAPTTVLLDPEGKVGRRYGAKTTPHMFIIDRQGLLIYAGAIDDSPSTDPADVATATNYVQAAFDEALAGKSISVPATASYGCSVKY